jgi:phosphopantothenate---cysteine ligase (CTP)
MCPERMDPASQPRFLMTAGNTREMIDRVRDWGNIFTGLTGFAIAQELAKIGSVDLVTSNLAHIDQVTSDGSMMPYSFRSHADLLSVLETRMKRTRYAGIFMTAAVADYTPDGAYEVVSRTSDEKDPTLEHLVVRNVQAGKVKSFYSSIMFAGKPTKKIVDLFRKPWGHTGLLVKFKLEVGISNDALIEIAEKSRRASDADYIVANTLDMVSGASAGAFLLSNSGHEWVPRGQLATRLLKVTREYLAAHPPVA